MTNRRRDRVFLYIRSGTQPLEAERLQVGGGGVRVGGGGGGGGGRGEGGRGVLQRRGEV